MCFQFDNESAPAPAFPPCYIKRPLADTLRDIRRKAPVCMVKNTLHVRLTNVHKWGTNVQERLSVINQQCAAIRKPGKHPHKQTREQQTASQTHRRHLWLIKVQIMSFIMLQKLLFQINAVFLNFLFICESWKIKCITVSAKILCSTTVFNIDNNQKCFLSSILLWFLKIMWLWRLE